VTRRRQVGYIAIYYQTLIGGRESIGITGILLQTSSQAAGGASWTMFCNRGPPHSRTAARPAASLASRSPLRSFVAVPAQEWRGARLPTIVHAGPQAAAAWQSDSSSLPLTRNRRTIAFHPECLKNPTPPHRRSQSDARVRFSLTSPPHSPIYHFARPAVVSCAARPTIFLHAARVRAPTQVARFSPNDCAGPRSCRSR
jgi:hypothetical protein